TSGRVLAVLPGFRDQSGRREGGLPLLDVEVAAPDESACGVREQETGGDLRAVRLAPRQGDLDGFEGVHVGPQGLGHRGRQGYVPLLVALWRSEYGLPSDQLHLPDDPDDAAVEVERILSQSHDLPLT